HRQAPPERRNTAHAHPSESLRNPGARGFVWSGTVENDLFIARNITFLFENLGHRVESAGNPEPIRTHIELIPEIEHKDVPVCVHDRLQLFRCDAIYRQRLQKTLPLQVSVSSVSSTDDRLSNAERGSELGYV